jgi:hypothetical protein
LWRSGALAADNSIYYMPSSARRIMRLNPDNDTLSSVGGDLGGREMYSGTVVGNNDCMYGMPFFAKHIIKFDPEDPDITCTVGGEAEIGFYCGDGGVLG